MSIGPQLFVGRARIEVVISTFCAVGIIAAALYPAENRFQSPPEAEIFEILEKDYISPLPSSPKTVAALNRAATEIAVFAGYDEVQARVCFSNRSERATITRYAGQIFQVLGTGFIIREGTQTPCNRVFISERFWRRAFAGDAGALGKELQLNGQRYRIAGVVRSIPGEFERTDLWLPVFGSRGSSEDRSMKVIGAFRPGVDSRRGVSLLEKLTRNAGSDETRGAKFLPLSDGLSAGLSESVVVMREDRRRPRQRG